MSRGAFHCMDPKHEGDRLVVSAFDQIVVSEDHMLANGKTRRHRIHVTNLCRKCSDAREQELRPNGPKTEPLFCEQEPA